MAIPSRAFPCQRKSSLSLQDSAASLNLQLSARADTKRAPHPLFESIWYPSGNHVQLRNGDINPCYSPSSLLDAGRTSTPGTQDPRSLLCQRRRSFHIPHRHAHPMLPRARARTRLRWRIKGRHFLEGLCQRMHPRQDGGGNIAHDGSHRRQAVFGLGGYGEERGIVGVGVFRLWGVVLFESVRGSVKQQANVVDRSRVLLQSEPIHPSPPETYQEL